MPQLMIIVASVRPGRVGWPVGQWFSTVAERHGGFEVRTVDLAELALPLMDEPHHPRLRQYQHPYTRQWSQMVQAADAFVFVMPEYNFGMSAPLKNALDYLYHEWHYKPVGFVSYGGISGGLRAVQMVKQVVTALKMMPIPEAVTVPFVAQKIQDGRFIPSPDIEQAANTMLDELQRWESALRALRVQRTP
jgi:NAD(P)H-dependent FMN reductase